MRTFKIEIHVRPEDATAMKIVLQSMIANYNQWEKGREPLKYRFGQHLSDNVILVVDDKLSQQEGGKDE